MDRPGGGIPVRQAGRSVRVNDVWRQWIAGPSTRSRWRQLGDSHLERVARRRALHPDRTALRIGWLSPLHAAAIDPKGIKRLHDDGVTREHVERGRVLTHRV